MAPSNRAPFPFYACPPLSYIRRTARDSRETIFIIASNIYRYLNTLLIASYLLLPDLPYI